MQEDRDRFRAFGQIRPLQMGALVFRKIDLAFRVSLA